MLVFEYIKEKLSNHRNVHDSNYINNFINSLSNEKDFNSIRMLICIGIDIKNSIKIIGTDNPNDNYVINEIAKCILLTNKIKINLRTSVSISNRLKLAKAFNTISPIPFNPCISCDNSSPYIRIYNFRNYMLYVVNTNKSVNQLIDIIDPNEMDRYLDEFLNFGKYNNINISNLGYNKWVFVADSNEIQSIGYRNLITIIDRLGLYYKDTSLGTYFVSLEYDPNFSESTFQPDSTSGDWGDFYNDHEIEGNEYYLSYIDHDTYGRTYSITGIQDSLKERIHRPFSLNAPQAYSMKAVKLGVLDKILLKGNTIDILRNALHRFYKA